MDMQIQIRMRWLCFLPIRLDKLKKINYSVLVKLWQNIHGEDRNWGSFGKQFDYIHRNLCLKIFLSSETTFHKQNHFLNEL